MTPVHENFIPKISIYKKVMFFTNIFSIENLEPYGIQKKGPFTLHKIIVIVGFLKVCHCLVGISLHYVST